MAAPPAEHPKYSEMITQAIVALKERNGSSRQAILKYIQENFKVSSNPTVVSTHLRMALMRGVASGILIQVTGTGASGSFKIGDQARPATTKPATTKPSAKKPAAKKPAAKKATQKPSAKKPPPKKPTTATKPAAKKPGAKKPAAKKTPKKSAK